MKVAHFMLRATRLGPLVPAKVWMDDAEPGEPSNKLDRGNLSVYPRAAIGLAEVEPEWVIDRLWGKLDWRPGIREGHWRHPQPITEAEYNFQMARLRHAEKWRPDAAELAPRRAVRAAQMELPSFIREEELSR